MRSTLGYPKFYALPSCFLGYGVLNQTLQITFYLRMKLREELKYPPVCSVICMFIFTSRNYKTDAI